MALGGRGGLDLEGEERAAGECLAPGDATAGRAPAEEPRANPGAVGAAADGGRCAKRPDPDPDAEPDPDTGAGAEPDPAAVVAAEPRVEGCSLSLFWCAARVAAFLLGLLAGTGAATPALQAPDDMGGIAARGADTGRPRPPPIAGRAPASRRLAAAPPFAPATVAPFECTAAAPSLLLDGAWVCWPGSATPERPEVDAAEALKWGVACMVRSRAR